MVRAESVTATLLYTYTSAALSTGTVDGLRIAQDVDGVVTAFAWDWATGVPEMLSDGESVYLVGLDTLGWEDTAGWTYALPDTLGSVRQETDATGDVTAAREWTPYGVEVGGAMAGLGYTGEWFDPYMNHYYLRTRWYAPYLTQFISPDPILPDFSDPQSQSSYSYAGNNPINYIDPTGLWRWWGTSSFYHLVIEHWYEMPLPFFNPTKQLEYPIPGAFWKHPDMFNSVTGDVYEIEPWYKVSEGARQVGDYVSRLNDAARYGKLTGQHLLGPYNWNNVKFHSGLGLPSDWPGKYRFADPRYPYLDLVADYQTDGVVIYWHEFNDLGYAIVAWKLGHLLQVPNKKLLKPNDWQPPGGLLPQPQPVPVITTIDVCNIAKGVVIVGETVLILNALEDMATGGLGLANDFIVIPAGLLLIDWGQKQAALLPVEDMGEPQ